VHVRAELDKAGVETTPWEVIRDEKVEPFAKATGWEGEVDTIWLIKSLKYDTVYIGIMVHGCLVAYQVVEVKQLEQMLLRYQQGA